MIVLYVSLGTLDFGALAAEDSDAAKAVFVQARAGLESAG